MMTSYPFNDWSRQANNCVAIKNLRFLLNKPSNSSTDFSAPPDSNLYNLTSVGDGFFGTITNPSFSIDAQVLSFVMQECIQRQTLELMNDSIKKLREECIEEGFKEFSDTAKQNAEQILNSVYKKFPDYQYDIYPTKDQEIAIDCKTQKGGGVLILCDSQGGAAYFSTLNGKNSRFRCDNMDGFSYSSLWKVFEDMKKKYVSGKSLTSMPKALLSSKQEFETVQSSIESIYNDGFFLKDRR